jgi:hypothetical protein
MSNSFRKSSAVGKLTGGEIMRIRSSIKSRDLLFGCVLLLATSLFARESSDVIIMKNGDHVTGQIKSLNSGVLSVSLDYVDGTISVDWLKVARVESSQLFVILTQNGSSYEGSLVTPKAIPGQPVKIQITQTAGNKIEIQRSQVVRMTQTSEEFHQRFSGDISLGTIYSKGNQATQYNFATDVQYLRERWAAEASYSSSLSANSGSSTSTRNQLTLSAYHLLRKHNYFYEGLGNFLQSSVQGIRLQTSLGGGIGYFFKDTNTTTVSLVGGLAWQGTNYTTSVVPQSAQNVAAALIAGEVKLFKFKKTNLDVTATLLPALSDPGRVRFNMNTTYYLKLFGNLSWNLSFYGNWDNQPPPGLSGSDYGTSSGVTYTFGNK